MIIYTPSFVHLQLSFKLVSCMLVSFSSLIFYEDDSDDQLIRFVPCQRSSCADVAIEDDDVVEKTERVVIRLERTDDLSNTIRFGVSFGVIEVEDDNDGMCYNIIMYTYQYLSK